jgi:hypothetical protein
MADATSACTPSSYEIVARPRTARESEDHAVVDEIGLVLPSISALLDGGDREFWKRLADDPAHDVVGQLAIQRWSFIEGQ